MEVQGFPAEKIGLSSLALTPSHNPLKQQAGKRGLQSAPRLLVGLPSAPRLRARVTIGSFPSAARLGRAARAGTLNGDSNADPKQIASPSQQSSRYCDKPNFPGASLHRCQARISVEMLHQKRIGCRNLLGDRICFSAFPSLESNCRQFRRSPPY